ncbi:MAG: cation:proton antiporter [Bacteroidales bacterium]|nr:cation:proton antiporter [Bacteroidales bacterium]MBN2749758.1 cation:proton antiporter [Bacteroidales bacterium]
MHSIAFEFPITDPILLFGLGLLIILLIPILFTRIKLPGILGLILAGLIIGPNGLHIVERSGSIELLGNIGLMYLMFLAGLELDLLNFQKVRNRSFIFGGLTFIIPLVLGYTICRYLLDFQPLTSLLVSSMFSTHTLISYPIVSRYRITKLEPVGITVGGTIITDTLVLVLLIVITALNTQNLSWTYWVTLLGTLSLYLFFIIGLFPVMGKWFFSRIKSDSISQFVFVLFMVFLAGGLAIITGIEPIIGAFLAGITLNKLIPHSSILKNRLEFFGNALFIPFFLVFVGTFIDLKVFFQGLEALQIAIVLTVIAIISKWLAAFATQKIYGYSTNYRKLIFGLSSSHAAATIAVIMIGYKIGIVDINILNATILIILITCLISSLATESAAKKIVVNEASIESPTEQKERILVPIANPSTVEDLFAFSRYMKQPETSEPIYTLAVANNESEVSKKFALLKHATELASGMEYKIEPVTRVDINIASGITRACKELQITDLVLGWNGRISPNQWVFGTILEQVLSDLRQSIFVVSLKHPINNIDRIKVMVPLLAEFEPGFSHWVKMLCHLSEQTSAKLQFCIPEKSQTSFTNILNLHKLKVPFDITPIDSWEDYIQTNGKNDKNTFYVLVSARKGAISYTSMLSQLPQVASKKLKSSSFSIVFPLIEQITTLNTGTWLSGDASKHYTDNDSSEMDSHPKNHRLKSTRSHHVKGGKGE